MNDFIYSDEMIRVAFSGGPVDDLLKDAPDTVSAATLLALTDTVSDECMDELLGLMNDLNTLIDVSDLPLGSFGEAARRLREEEQLVAAGTLMTALEEGDPLRLYLEELAAIPVAGDLNVLAMELLDANRDERFEEGLFTRILNLSLSRVVQIAQEYVGCGVLLLDLMQEGSLGLWSELECYAGGDFEAFRDRSIRRAMANAIIRQARACGLGQKMRQAVEDYRMVDEQLLTELGRNPILEEIAERMHMTVSEVESVRKFLENARMVGKAHEVKAPGEESPEDNQAVEDTAYYQTRERVDSLMSGITELESKVVTMRYGLDGKAPQTAAEVGRKLNLTVTEVVELETAALTKMRQSGN